jgi:hypothetical protein
MDFCCSLSLDRPKMKTICFWANPDADDRSRCPGTRLQDILTPCPARSHPRKNYQPQLIITTALNRPRHFPNDSLERKSARERGAGGGRMIRNHICLPKMEPVQGWCCMAQRLPSQKAKKCCSRVNAKDETVSLRGEPEVLYPMSPTASGPFLPRHVACPFRCLTVV